jgi:2-keto-4-pentenoate hydratase/2-oxohepta-3-ene-1,7-dioic acid hydratase in catechol pathway
LRWVTYQFAGRTSYGVVATDGIVDVTALTADPPPSLRSALALGLQNILPPKLPTPGLPLDDVCLLPPVTDPGKIICVGMNYRDHRDEMRSESVEHPVLFTRFADTQIGSGAMVPIPTPTAQLDYEGELAVVIGRHLHRAVPSEVGDAIVGYACYNDFSVRDWQFHTSQWLPGKNFPGTGAFGPWLTTPDAAPPLEDMVLVTTVNGDVRQRASIADLIFSVPDIISYISSFTPLAPGDVIVTGTPAGVGMKRQPPVYLGDGDAVAVAIDGLGLLVNTVRGFASATSNGETKASEGSLT